MSEKQLNGSPGQATGLAEGACPDAAAAPSKMDSLPIPYTTEADESSCSKSLQSRKRSVDVKDDEESNRKKT